MYQTQAKLRQQQIQSKVIVNNINKTKKSQNVDLPEIDTLRQSQIHEIQDISHFNVTGGLNIMKKNKYNAGKNNSSLK